MSKVRENGRKESSNFGRGGCFTCVSCGQKTRATGRGDHEHVQLCAPCYDECERVNAEADNNRH